MYWYQSIVDKGDKEKEATDFKFNEMISYPFLAFFCLLKESISGERFKV